ncbi:MAG TPA: hypothetical protein VLY03_04560 [Bacteroidota bacterium]|nr:hypothetical protein [Bacteroidota bacterium]
MERDRDRKKDDNKKESRPSGPRLMTVLRARDVGSYLDPLGLNEVKNSKLAQYGQRVAIGLLALMGLAEISFLVALLIRLLL